ncbi:unnamed protein product [Brachionus calyciflorus]|uniref:Interferon-related developmental regulator 1 n=1 Tax=Brachionus calyciflorus TaxID=104777 RepID=A0A813N984_9BILA|nr:unnamed protein product [Brachionus calyciflorus]
MPKNKKKNKPLSSRGNQSGDDSSEFNADENASTISNASTNMSYQDVDMDETGKKITDDFIEKIDNIDSELNICLDGLLEKGFKEREDSLKLLKKLFSHKYLIDNILNKRFTLSESLIKCLKKGKTNEQVLSANVLMLTLIQLGSSPTETNAILTDCKQTLTELIDDEKVEPEVRAECVKALALAVFITNENSTDLVAILEKFEGIFSKSFAKGDNTLRVFPPRVYELHAAALSSWCLLLCTMPLHFVNKLSIKYVKNFKDFLRSQDTDLRICAGETISFLYELAQCDSHSDVSVFEDDNLLELLRNLASESSKFRSKKEKKAQRSSFRDILKTMEEGEFDVQTVKFGTESLILDNWVKRKEYETFRDVLGTGINSHLAENEYLRDLFDLGPPVQGNEQARKAALSLMSSKQKALMNKEQFKSRTKSLLKKRETKDYAQGQEMDDED